MKTIHIQGVANLVVAGLPLINSPFYA